MAAEKGAVAADLLEADFWPGIVFRIQHYGPNRGHRVFMLHLQHFYVAIAT